MGNPIIKLLIESEDCRVTSHGFQRLTGLYILDGKNSGSPRKPQFLSHLSGKLGDKQNIDMRTGGSLNTC